MWPYLLIVINNLPTTVNYKGVGVLCIYMSQKDSTQDSIVEQIDAAIEADKKLKVRLANSEVSWGYMALTEDDTMLMDLGGDAQDVWPRERDQNPDNPKDSFAEVMARAMDEWLADFPQTQTFYLDDKEVIDHLDDYLQEDNYELVYSSSDHRYNTY